MSIEHMQKSIEGVIGYYASNPDEARSPDKPATAVVEEGLRCRSSGPNDWTLVSDMPKGLGGGGAAPTPGWLMRAALANCEVTMLALRAAQLGVALTTLEVTVGSTSDDRGLLGMDDAIPAGPLDASVRIRIGAEGVRPERLQEIVHWAEAHSPVGDAVRRAIPMKTEVEIV